jgi:hypothetical protein
MYTSAGSGSDRVAVLGWHVRTRGQEPLGKVKHVSLTGSGFVHTAIITHEPEGLGFDIRVDIGN